MFSPNQVFTNWEGAKKEETEPGGELMKAEMAWHKGWESDC